MIPVRQDVILGRLILSLPILIVNLTSTLTLTLIQRLPRQLLSAPRTA